MAVARSTTLAVASAMLMLLCVAVMAGSSDAHTFADVNELTITLKKTPSTMSKLLATTSAPSPAKPSSGKPGLPSLESEPLASTDGIGSVDSAAQDALAMLKKNCKLDGVFIAADYTYLTGVDENEDDDGSDGDEADADAGGDEDEDDEEDMVYVVCDKKTGMPTCYLDLHIADRKRGQHPDPEVPCPTTKAAKRALARQNEQIMARAGKMTGSEESQANPRRRLGLRAKKASRKWPEGVVCYDFDLIGSPENQTAIMAKWDAAMTSYRTAVGITFETIAECQTRQTGTQPTAACKNCQRVLNITNRDPDAAYATLGFFRKTSVDLDLNVGDAFSSDDLDYEKGTYLHEMGHVLGLHHEHSHKKRPVIIVQDEMEADEDPDDYRIQRHTSRTEYDPSSIMHYYDEPLCLPHKVLIGTNFCDADVDEARAIIEKCVPVVRSIHCESTPLSPRDIERYSAPNTPPTLSATEPTALSQGDIELLQAMYPRP